MSEKKRSTYQRGSMTDLPKHVDKTKYGYRWISATKLSENSDEYEPRGWEVDKNAEGKTTKRGDLILGRMPIDQFEAMKAEKETARKEQIGLLGQQQAEENERDSHEFRKKGGKVKFELKQEL